jgi:hypothetical protein
MLQFFGFLLERGRRNGDHREGKKDKNMENAMVGFNNAGMDRAGYLNLRREDFVCDFASYIPR